MVACTCRIRRRDVPVSWRIWHLQRRRRQQRRYRRDQEAVVIHLRGRVTTHVDVSMSVQARLPRWALQLPVTTARLAGIRADDLNCCWFALKVQRARATCGWLAVRMSGAPALRRRLHESRLVRAPCYIVTCTMRRTCLTRPASYPANRACALFLTRTSFICSVL